MKKRMLMFVYNDINQDARVQRSIDALEEFFEIKLVCVGSTNEMAYNGLVINHEAHKGMRKYFEVVLDFIRYARKEKYDVLYLHDYFSCLPGLFLWRGKTVIYDAHELMVDRPTERLDLRSRFFHFFEKRIIKKSNLIICAQEKRAEIMKEYFGLDDTPYVVPNYSELPIDKEYHLSSELKKFLEKGDKQVLVYAGALTDDRRLDLIIGEMESVSDKYKLLIIGEGNAKSALISHAKDCACLECFFAGGIPYRYLGYVLKKCDFGYMSYPCTSINNTYCAPNKIFEYASVGLPMICNDNPTLYEVVGKNGIGLIISQCEEAGYAQTVPEALEHMSLHYKDYIKAIDIFRKNNSWDELKKEYLNRVIEICEMS